jgi:hypothetical protein
MAVGIYDLQEASGHIAATCRQQDCAFGIAEGSLEVLNRWSCFADHCYLSKVFDQKVIHRLSPKILSNPKIPATP